MGRKRGSLLAVNVQREGRAQSLSKLITNVNVTRTVITQEKIVIPLRILLPVLRKSYSYI